MRMLDVEQTVLHRHEYQIGVETIDHVVGRVGQQRVIVVLIDVGCRAAGLANRDADEA